MERDLLEQNKREAKSLNTLKFGTESKEGTPI